MVPPKQALALSLVFHELATNASKYGALSKSGGTVHIKRSPAEDEMLSLRWREHVEGEVKKPEHEGFGSLLITMNVSREVGGSVHREYTADGLSAEIRLPWDPHVRDRAAKGLEQWISRPGRGGPTGAEEAFEQLPLMPRK